MGKQLIFLPLIALLVYSDARAASNGNGGGGNPQIEFCDGLFQSCMAPCGGMNDGSLKGAVAERQCNQRCLAATKTCLAGMKTGQPPVLKKKLPQ